MKKLHIAMAIAASVSTAAIAQAQDYQIEGGLSMMSYSADAAGAPEPSTISLDGTYHIETVSTSGVVLNEAAFVGRNNNINASYTDYDPDVAGADNGDITDIGVEWWFEDIYAAANMNSDDSKGKGLEDQQTLQLGYMVQENTLVALVMETGDQPEDGMGLRAKYVGDMGGSTINLEAQFVQTDGPAGGSDSTATHLSGDYYFSDTLSAGLAIDDFDTGAPGEKNQTTLSVKNFFTPVISGELDYVMNPRGVKDDSAMVIRAAMRF